MFQLDLENAEEPEIKLPTSTGSSKKQESSIKTSTFVLLTMPKPLTVWITTNWKILQEMGIPDHLTCLLKNLCAGQEATVRTGHGTTDWFQIGKGVRQGYLLSPCLFNLYAEYIMRNAGLGEAEAVIKIVWSNINNLKYADDTTLMAEIEEELKSLLMKMKEESETAGLKLNFMEKEMATNSSILAWKIPWTEEPGRLQFMGVTKSWTRLSDFTKNKQTKKLRKLKSWHPVPSLHGKQRAKQRK